MLDIFRENSIPVEGIAPAGGNPEKLQVVSTMGISGDLRGNVVFGLNYESARSIVGMLFKANDLAPEGDGFGDLQKAAIGEIANQITGRALMGLSQRAFDCNMSPPTVFTGDLVIPDLGQASDKQYVSRVRGDFGSAVLHVGIQEPKKSGKNS